MQPGSVFKTIFSAVIGLILFLSSFGAYVVRSEKLSATRQADAARGAPCDTVFSGHVYRRLAGKSRLHCGAACAGNATGCLSFNYCGNTRVCELNSAGATQYPQDLTHAVGCNYYDISHASPRFDCQTVTDTTYNYRYLPSAVNVRRLEFWVQATNDAHISLSPTLPANTGQIYELVLGSANNTYAVIRRCALCTNQVSAQAVDELSGSESRGFWVTFDLPTGRLAAGREGQETPIIEWVDPAPLDVKYVGFSTGWGSTGVFRYSCAM